MTASPALKSAYQDVNAEVAGKEADGPDESGSSEPEAVNFNPAGVGAAPDAKQGAYFWV